MATSMSSIDILFYICTLLLSVSICVMHIVVLVIPEWTVMGYLKIGLFQMCHGATCTRSMDIPGANYEYHEIMRYSTAGVVTLAMLINSISSILTFVFILIKAKRRPSLMSSAMGLSITAGSMCLVGLLLWMLIFVDVAKYDILMFRACFWITLVLAILCYMHAGLCSGVKRRGLLEISEDFDQTPLTNDVIGNISHIQPCYFCSSNRMEPEAQDEQADLQPSYGGSPSGPPSHFGAAYH